MDNFFIYIKNTSYPHYPQAICFIFPQAINIEKSINKNRPVDKLWITLELSTELSTDFIYCG